MESPLLELLTQAFLMYVPAYLANMAPPVAAALQLPGGTPLSIQLFGTRKTYRGLASGVVGGILGALLLWSLKLGWYGGEELNTAIFAGGLMGAGALIGDAVESAVKRVMDIKPGRPFVPWDQIDFIIGATALGALALPISWSTFLAGLLITPPLHLLINIAAHGLRLKQEWW